jgi:hypothetical protein
VRRTPFLGIDIASLSCDAVLEGEDVKLAGWAVVPTGASTSVAVARAREGAPRSAGAMVADLGSLDEQASGEVTHGAALRPQPRRT